MNLYIFLLFICLFQFRWTEALLTFSPNFSIQMQQASVFLCAVLYITYPPRASKLNMMVMWFHAALKDKQKNKHTPTTSDREPWELSRLHSASLILPVPIKALSSEAENNHNCLSSSLVEPLGTEERQRIEMCTRMSTDGFDLHSMICSNLWRSDNGFSKVSFLFPAEDILTSLKGISIKFCFSKVQLTKKHFDWTSS